jgi:hypothetical protein
MSEFYENALNYVNRLEMGSYSPPSREDAATMAKGIPKPRTKRATTNIATVSFD